MNKRTILLLCALFLFLIICINLFGQDEAGVNGDAPETQPLPRGFRNLTLGMEIDAAKEALKKDGYFHYRGDPDVTMLPRPNYSVIESDGVTFIDRGFFQFHEKNLYIIILLLNDEKVDYYSLYTTLRDKYGEPDYLDPKQMVWENELTRMALERPLQIKYIDRDVFEQLQKEGRAEESMERMMQDSFLEEF